MLNWLNKLKNYHYYKYQALIICFIIVCAAAFVFALIGFTKYVHFYGDEQYSPPRCTIEGYNFRVCKLCGHVDEYDFEPAIGHRYSEWIVRDEPGEVTPGYGYYKCTVCYNTVYDFIDSTSDMDKIYLSVDVDGRGNARIQLKYSSTDSQRNYYVKLDDYFAATVLDKPDYTVTFYADANCEYEVSADIAGYGKSGQMYLLGCGSDATFARNAVNSQIWAEMLSTRDGASAEYLMENQAGVQSFHPVLLYYNGAYRGVYTLGEPLDGSSMALDGASPQAMLYSTSSNANSPIDLDSNNDYLLLYNSEEDHEWVEQSFNEFVNFVQTAQGSDFVSGIDEYLDVDAAIDYMLFMYFSYASNNSAKNIIWTTIDGRIWFPTPYKLEATWGLRSNGRSLTEVTQAIPSWRDGNVVSQTSVTLYDKLLNLMLDRVSERSEELSLTALDNEHVKELFEEYISSISSEAYIYETSVWPDFPSANLTDYEQICDFIDRRYPLLGEFFVMDLN